MKKPLFVGCALVCGALFATTTQQAELTLVCNTNIAVAADDVLDVAVLGGEGFTLVKTGGGTLRIRSCTNDSAVIDLQEGRFECVEPNATDLFADAYFHVDASNRRIASSSDEVLENGTNFIAKIRDVRSTVSVYGAPSKSKKPFISPDVTQNGLPLIDFGTLWATSSRETDEVQNNGYGGDFVWSVPAEPKHIFIVAGDREEIHTLNKTGATGPQFVGFCPTKTYSTKETTLLRGTMKSISGSNGPDLMLANGANRGYYSTGRLDGVAFVAQKTFTLPPGMHLIDVKMCDPLGDSTKHVNSFANDRGWYRGGCRMGEAVIFERDLTDYERESIQAHLTAKWFARTNRLSRLGVAAGATYDLGTCQVKDVILNQSQYVKYSTNTVAITDLEEGLGTAVTSLDIRSGSLKVNPLYTTNTWFHLDANDTNAMTFTAVDDKQTIKKWLDVNRNGRYCSSQESNPDSARFPSASKRRPYLRMGYTNDLAVVDCRGAATRSGTKPESVPEEGGGAFKWNVACTNIRETLMVVMDVGPAPGYEENASAITPFWGVSDNSMRQFLRTISKGRNLIIYDHTICTWKDSSVWVDGVAIAKPFSTAYPDGLHVLAIRTTADRTANAFACDGNYSMGGQRIGEALVFTNVLSDVERTRFTSALRCKWFKDTSLAVVRTYADVAVSFGAALELPDRAEIEGTLTLAGTLTVPSVRAAKMDLTSGTGVVSGRLDLSVAGEILIAEPTAAQLKAGSWKILTCTDISSIARGWTVKTADGRRFSVKKGMDGLYAREIGGFVIILR